MGSGSKQDRRRFQTTARCGLTGTAQRKEPGEPGGRVHASGEGLQGYLLLHSAFGPSSMQLREKTEPERQGWGRQNTVRSVVR